MDSVGLHVVGICMEGMSVFSQTIVGVFVNGRITRPRHSSSRCDGPSDVHEALVDKKWQWRVHSGVLQRRSSIASRGHGVLRRMRHSSSWWRNMEPEIGL